MRRALLTLILFLLVVAACAPAAGTEEPVDSNPLPTASPAPDEATETPTQEATEEPTEEPLVLGAAEETALKQLAANLGLDEDEISVLSSEATEFPDACLGVVMDGILCAQVITPGRIIVLEADGMQYEYHTDEDGGRVQPVSLALIWKREGGIAGFCDTLTVFRSGEVYASQCKSDGEGKVGTFDSLLSARERAEFNEWIVNYGEVELDASDPKGVSDRMVITIELFGTGDAEPTESEQQDLLDFAQDLYQELAY